jgi:colicin import membrane protein
VKPVLDATGQAVLPLPARQVYEPPIQAMEMGAESAKRSIQNALGMYNASVGRQDTNVKSGVAIKALDVQSDQGNYHFIDNYDRALEHAGRILDDMLPYVYDQPRQVSVRKPDDQVKSIRINEPYQDPKTGEVQEYRIGPGEHNVTISTGPSYESQREEASAFADAVAGNPQIFGLIGDLVVKLKNLGPIGDEMAKRLTPPQFAEEKGQNNPQLMAQKLQQMDQMVQLLTEQLNKASEELKGDKAKAEADVMIAKMKLEAEMQAAQMKIQADSQATIAKGQADASVQAQKSEIETRKLAADLELKRQIAAEEIASKERIARQEMELEMAKARLQIESQEKIAYMQAQVARETAAEDRKVAAENAAEDRKVAEKTAKKPEK